MHRRFPESKRAGTAPQLPRLKAYRPGILQRYEEGAGQTLGRSGRRRSLPPSSPRLFRAAAGELGDFEDGPDRGAEAARSARPPLSAARPAPSGRPRRGRPRLHASRSRRARPRMSDRVDGPRPADQLAGGRAIASTTGSARPGSSPTWKPGERQRQRSGRAPQRRRGRRSRRSRSARSLSARREGASATPSARISSWSG